MKMINRDAIERAEKILKKDKVNIELITHNDLDGISCITLIGIADTDRYYIDPSTCDYKQTEMIIEQELKDKNFDILFITDLRISENNFNKIKEYNKNHTGRMVFIIDHHDYDYNIDNYEFSLIQQSTDYKDLKECGTSLFYKALKEFGMINEDNDNKLLKSYVEYVRLYDTWEWTKKFKDDENPSCILNSLSNFLNCENFVSSLVKIIKENNSPSIITDSINVLASAFENYRTKEIRKLNLRFVRDFAITYEGDLTKSYNIITTLSDSSNSSKIAEMYKRKQLYQFDENVDFLLNIDLNTSSCSLRSISQSCNVLEIAQCFGGGGHKKASGFTIDASSTFKGVFSSIFKGLTLEK